MLVITALVDPGYLPFFYPTAGRRQFTQDELRSGCAITPQQIQWAKKQEVPARVYFSRSMGWFVIRGDHYCKFTNTWIGLYNHRYFLLATVYTLLYIVVYIAHLAFQWWNQTLLLLHWKALAMIAISLPFLYQLVTSFGSQIVLVSSNCSLVDFLRKNKMKYRYYKDFVSNWEDVCGSRKFWWLWWLPVPLPAVVDGFGYGEGGDHASFL
jgi:hypothetical protein